MITNQNYIKDIKDKNFILGSLGLELTRKCNLKCAHCYKDKPENVDISKAVLDKVFAQFPKIETIHLLGGESTLNEMGLADLYAAMKKYQTSFNKFSLVINGTKFEDSFFVILTKIAELQEKQGKNTNVAVAVSNDSEHDEAYKNKKSFDVNTIASNIKLFGERYPKVRIGFVKYKDFKKDGVMNVGRGRYFAADNKTREDYYNSMNIWEHPETLNTHLTGFTVDAKGNVTHSYVEYKQGDSNNFGNVLINPIDEILIKHGKEIEIMPKWFKQTRAADKGI